MSTEPLAPGCAQSQAGDVTRDTSSKWFATPNAERWRKAVNMTLAINAIADLDTLAELEGVSRSAMVQELITAEMARRGLPQTPEPKKKTLPKKK